MNYTKVAGISAMTIGILIVAYEATTEFPWLAAVAVGLTFALFGAVAVADTSPGAIDNEIEHLNSRLTDAHARISEAEHRLGAIGVPAVGDDDDDDEPPTSPGGGLYRLPPRPTP